MQLWIFFTVTTKLLSFLFLELGSFLNFHIQMNVGCHLGIMEQTFMFHIKCVTFIETSTYYSKFTEYEFICTFKIMYFFKKYDIYKNLCLLMCYIEAFQ